MSGMNINPNRRVLRVLLGMKSRIIDAEVKLLAEGKTDDAEELENCIDRLDDLIRKLRKNILNDWLSKVDNLRTNIGQINSEVEEAVENIKDDIETAKSVVKLVGYVDDAVEAAAKVFV